MLDNDSKLRSRLEKWLGTKMLKAKDITISDVNRPSVGASSETSLFDIRWDNAGERQSMAVVLRSAPYSEPGIRGVFPEYDVSSQFRIMKVLQENTDVPVARVLWLEEDPSIIGVPFYLMQKLDGDVVQDRPPYHGSGVYFDETPEIRRQMCWDLLEILARLHGADWRCLGLDFLVIPGAETDPVDRQLAYWDRYLNHWVKESSQETHPTMEAALVWLKENRYEPKRIALCWGDAKLSNVLYSKPDRRVLALMDWEMAFIGDPEADLASWYISDLRANLGSGLPPLEGTPDKEEMIAHYEKYVGSSVNNFLFNEVLATFWRGLVQLRIMKNLRGQGIPISDEMMLNNFPTQHLSRLLGLPLPGRDPHV